MYTFRENELNIRCKYENIHDTRASEIKYQSVSNASIYNANYAIH